MWKRRIPELEFHWSKHQLRTLGFLHWQVNIFKCCTMRGLGSILVYFTAKASPYRPSKANPSHRISMMRERAEYSPGLFREAVKACCIPLIYRVWCTQSPNFRASAVHKLKTKTKNWYEYGTWLFKTPWCQTWRNVQNTSFHIEDRALLDLHLNWHLMLYFLYEGGYQNETCDSR